MVFNFQRKKRALSLVYKSVFVAVFLVAVQSVDRCGSFWSKDSHFESVVRCDRRMAYSDAEELIEGMSTPSDDAGVMLKQLGALMAKFETTAFEKGQSFPFEHWEPDIGLDVPVPGFLKSRRIVDGLSFLVNFYAAQILDRHSLWREFLSVPAETDLPELMPAFVYGVADTQHHRALERLLQHHPDDCRLTGTTTTEVVDAMRGILGPEPSCCMNKKRNKQIKQELSSQSLLLRLLRSSPLLSRMLKFSLAFTLRSAALVFGAEVCLAKGLFAADSDGLTTRFLSPWPWQVAVEQWKCRWAAFSPAKNISCLSTDESLCGNS